MVLHYGVLVYMFVVRMQLWECRVIELLPRNTFWIRFGSSFNKLCVGNSSWKSKVIVKFNQRYQLVESTSCLALCFKLCNRTSINWESPGTELPITFRGYLWGIFFWLRGGGVLKIHLLVHLTQVYTGWFFHKLFILLYSNLVKEIFPFTCITNDFNYKPQAHFKDFLWLLLFPCLKIHGVLSDTVRVKTALSKETSVKAQNLSKMILTSAIVLVGNLLDYGIADHTLPFSVL